MTKAQKLEQDDARTFLRERLPPGTVVYTTVTHVARSGMSRRIRVFVVQPEAGPGQSQVWDISGWVGRALGYRRNDRDGALVIGGCGMDMGFHLVNSLSYALHGNVTVGADATEASAKGRPFMPRPDTYRAGYSLTQRWL